MGIFRDLVSNVANTKMQEEQMRLANVIAEADSLKALWHNPQADPGKRSQAAALYTQLMGKQGGKHGKMLEPQIQGLLTGYIAATSPDGRSGAQGQGQPGQGVTPATATGQPQPSQPPSQPFPGFAPGIEGMPDTERQRIAGQLGATPAVLADTGTGVGAGGAAPPAVQYGSAAGQYEARPAIQYGTSEPAQETPLGAPGQPGLTPAAQEQNAIKERRGGFRGVLGTLAGTMGTVGKEMLGIPSGDIGAPWDPKAFAMTPDQERAENRRVGQAAGLRGDALSLYELTGKPPSDFGRGTGPTDAEIQQAGEQFDKFLAPDLMAAGIDRQRLAQARAQYMGGVKLAAAPPERLVQWTDESGQIVTAVRRGNQWIGADASNDGQIITPPAGAEISTVGTRRAPNATEQARGLAESAYATEVLKKPPGYRLTDDERLQAWAWGHQRMTTDPQWAAQMGTVPKTVQNPQGNPMIDLYAEEFITRGFTLPGGMSGAGFPRQVQVAARAVEMLQMAGYGIGDLPAIREGIKANSKEFDRVVQQGGQLAIFDGTIQSNLANLRVLNEKYDRTKYPAANRIWDAWVTGKGDDDAVNFAAQLHILAIEWAKAMTGLMSNANTPVTSAKDAEAIMSRYLSKYQIRELFDQVIVPDLNNRVNAQNGEKQTLQNAIRGFATLTPQQPTGGAATMPPSQTQPTQPSPTPPAQTTPAPAAPAGGGRGGQGGTGDDAVDYIKKHPPPK